MTIFQNDESFWPKVRNQAILRIIPMLLIAGAIGMFSGSRDVDLSVVLATISIGAICAIIGVSLSLKMHKKSYQSFRLFLEPEYIRREQLNLSPLEIMKADISEITKGMDGAFIIKGKNKGDLIIVPSYIQKKEELEALLSDYVLITVQDKQPFIQRYGILILLGYLAFFAASMLSTDKYIVTFSGVLISGFLFYSIPIVQMNKNLDNRAKRLSYLSVIPAISILVKVYMVWNN